MELKFLGKGAAFYPVLGNTSAYFIYDKNLFLIDCGESVFKKVYEKDLFSEIDNLYVFITHTHSDHIGSLSSLIFFQFIPLTNSLKGPLKFSVNSLYFFSFDFTKFSRKLSK